MFGDTFKTKNVRKLFYLTSILLFSFCSNQQKHINPKIQKVSLQKADIIKTHGANKKLFKFIKHKNFADWKMSIKKIISWYRRDMIKH